MANQRDTFLELRGKMDGRDPFVSGGHQIIKVPQSPRQTPLWARDKKTISRILLAAFPKLESDPKQRASAARWAVLIQLYFRTLMSRKQTAEQMSLSLETVKGLALRIKRLAVNLDGYKGRGSHKRRLKGNSKPA